MSLTPLGAATDSAAAAASSSSADENTHLLRTERRLFRSLRGGSSSGRSLDGTEQVREAGRNRQSWPKKTSLILQLVTLINTQFARFQLQVGEQVIVFFGAFFRALF